MKALYKLFAVLALAAVSLGASAYTTCANTQITIVNFDVGSSTPHLYLVSAAGVRVDVPSTDVNQKEIAAAALLAKSMGNSVDLYFTANGVSCSTAAYRTDLFAFVVKN